jgi:diguanylate cyclase (GGDEF)-like protein
VNALKQEFQRAYMTIRKKILLFSALALGAFLAAVYWASRFALLRGFSRLEGSYARENVNRLHKELENEQSRLAITARDYAQWDRTYDFMQSRNPGYVRSELPNDKYDVIRINLILLLDRKGRVVLEKQPGGDSLQPGDAAAIAAGYSSKFPWTRYSEVNGVLELHGRLMLLAYQPILDSRGEGEPRGTLVMGREINEAYISSLSKSAGIPLWLEPADHAPLGSAERSAWSDGSNSVVFEGESTLLAYLPIKDMSGKPRRLLVARIPYELNSEGKTVMRLLMLLLMLAGVVHCGVLLFVLEENLLARVASINSKIKQVTVSGDLSLRLDVSAKDELGSLAIAVNAMLAAIQKAKFQLLQAQESLRFHAEHDSLTGVLNRRAIRDVLRRELARCRRESNTLGVIVADVDHFKKINDHYGHGAGDAALVAVVQRIAATLRPYDIVGRYGGEEFLIIAPGCDLELTQKLAERVRVAVSNELIDLGNESIAITVSLGATLGTAESDPEFLVAVADAAMYRAKRNGRNRVETGQELSEQEEVEA